MQDFLQVYGNLDAQVVFEYACGLFLSCSLDLIGIVISIFCVFVGHCFCSTGIQGPSFAIVWLMILEVGLVSLEVVIGKLVGWL